MEGFGFVQIITDPGTLQSGLVKIVPFCQCCGSGSGIRCLFDPWTGSGIGFFPDRIPDLGSRIPTHIF
jgi:hypothetical protein